MTEHTVRSFDEQLKHLKHLIVQMGGYAEAELDNAIKLWERGEELYKLCVGKLDAAQGKIEELGRRAESARP